MAAAAAVAVAAAAATKTMIPSFSKTVQRFLTSLKTTPHLLRRDPSTLTEIKKKLHSQGDAESQGSGNQVTDQETCFAQTLEEHGFKHSSSNVPAVENGFYYIYQVNGTQRSIDFQAFHWFNNKKRRFVNFDLKHTKTDTFFLNDGWFHEDIIYIVSWMRKISEPRKKKVTESAIYIGRGQDIPSEEESALYEKLCEIKRQCNTDYKGVGSFHCYLRFANTYKCDRFTLEFTEESFENVMTSLAERKRPIIAQNNTDISNEVKTQETQETQETSDNVSVASE
jgi:hypothetical protein